MLSERSSADYCNVLCSKSVILVEQLEAAEARCRRLEATAAEYLELQAQQQPQYQELEQWRSLVGDLPEAERGPQAVMRMLDELRSQTLALADQTGQHKAESLRLQGKAATCTRMLTFGSQQQFLELYVWLAATYPADAFFRRHTLLMTMFRPPCALSFCFTPPITKRQE